MEKHGFVHDIEILSDQLPLLGTDIDSCTEKILDIEIFPNRPDLISDENYERAAMELNVGYSLGNNASLGLKYITDDNGDATAEESKYTYLTLTVTP